MKAKGKQKSIYSNMLIDNKIEKLSHHKEEKVKETLYNETPVLQPKRFSNESRKSEREAYSLREGHDVEVKHFGFDTPNRDRPLGDLKPSNSQEKYNSVRTKKSPKNLGEITSPQNFIYEKSVRDSKIKDKENIPRDFYIESKASNRRTPIAQDGSILPQGQYGVDKSQSFNKERSHSGSKVYKSKETVDMRQEKTINTR